MKAPVISVGLWRVLGVCIAVGLWLLLRSGSVREDTPFIREFTAIHMLSTKLALYARDHASFPPGHSGEGVSALVSPPGSG